ncbi:uncharacterized protein [Arachis hypogaea]|uniref:uncharacterized protein n=1 Tax=Arachis hypogaea TaxID=3818 RepID=UPI000DEC098D|nr:uncharacterized protein LOC112763565 [Arachis hypogaea]
MKFGSRESVMSAIKSYTISRGVDYTVYESEPQTFYAKCKGYGARRYNDKHTCTMGTILQDHAKLDSDTIADAIRPLVEENPSIKVKSIIAEVQSRFKYTTLLVWLKATTAKMPSSRVKIKTLPVYRESEEIQGERILHRIFWNFYPCIVAFRHCKPLVQVDGSHLYGKYKGELLDAVAQDGNQNIVPIAFAIVDGEMENAWEFFLTNLRRYVVTIDGVDNFLTEIIPSTQMEQEYNKNYQRLKEWGEAYTQWCDEIGVQQWVLEFNGVIVRDI